MTILAAPLNDRMVEADRVGYEHLKINADWPTLAQYFSRFEHQGLGINLATYVGATSIRRMVIGDDNRPPIVPELQKMKHLVADAMRDGAFGLSTSLQYAPAPSASTDELIALAAEAGRFGGIYSTHMRSEQTGIMQALDETVRIEREAAVVQNPALRLLQGKTLAQAAALRHQDPIDALLDILIEDQAFTSVAVFGMDEANVTLALQQPWVAVDNDSQGTAPTGPLGEEHPHPRAYATFPRILRKYVNEEILRKLTMWRLLRNPMSCQ
jgi:N-acyl-D-aspartate/D-glutamate deacylase